MFIIESHPFGPIDTNAILLGCSQTGDGVFIDAPMGGASHMIGRGAARSMKIKKILLTHSHWDHIADVAQVKETLSIPVSIHPLDAENLKFPGSDGLSSPFSIRGVEPDHYFVDGEEFLIGKLPIQVIHTPGHSPGGVCFYLPTCHLLISGDTLFRSSFGRIDLPTGEPNKMGQSLQKLAALPKETQVFPGHGEKTTIGSEGWLARYKNV